MGVKWWWSNRVETCLILVFLGLTSPLMMANKCGGGIVQQLPDPFERTEVRADCSNYERYRQPFFGDLHVHTSSSLDADLQGTRLGPDDAYAFAKGATVGIQPHDEQGNPLRTLSINGRPLDFTMVSDHAEFLGETSICRAPTPGLPGLEAQWASNECVMYREQPQNAWWVFNGFPLSTGNRLPTVCGEDGQLCYDESITLWTELQQAAESAYDRTSTCEFTSFVGYEWTKAPGGKNLHRNVVFRNDLVPTRPASFFEAPDPESLWDELEQDCADDGNPSTFDCDFLTIPHNSNLSAGLFFETIDRDGNPYDQAVAARREQHEPLIEVIQHKGQSECIPGSSPADELCGFEELPFNDLQGAVGGAWNAPLPQDFVREALKEGLAMEQSLGANPFKYGMVGGTDTHLGTPGAVAEDDYPGHGGAGDPAATELPPGLVDLPEFNPGGLTVIWAEENSRDSLFEAMRRREVYATSGTRPIVRFYGTFGDYHPNLCNLSNMVANADNLGPPMGGDLPAAPPNASPSFVVSALKDPVGVDLQHIQIVKGWVDQAGDTHETVFQVAGDAQNGADVDLNSCQPQGAGFAELCSVWTDPSFDPTQAAFYYARVVENPTCRWQQYQCNAAGVDCGVPATITEGFEACCDASVPATIQERAWTSPIWYSP